MGEAIEIIEDVGGEIIDIVDDAVDWVGDAISDVADFAYDEILQPVGNFVEGYVEGMLDDPIVTAAKIAAIATGNAWAIPLIDGAAVAIEGGDFEDVLTSVAISYATQTIGAEFGDIAGEFVGDAVGEAVSSEVAREIVTKAVGSGTQNAFSALLYGTDPLEAFAEGGMDFAIRATAGKAIESIGLDFKTPKKDANGNIIKDSSGNTVFETSPIPNTVTNIVTAGVSAALTGKEITPELIAGAVAQGVLTMDLVRSTGAELGIDFSKDSPELTYLAAGLQKVATIAATGGNGEQAAAAFKATLDAYGAKALSDVVKNSQVGDYISDTIDMMSGDYQKATGLVETINAEAEKRSGYLSEYESKRTELNGLLDDINARKAEIANLPTGTAAEQATYNSKVAELNSAVSNFNSKFASYNPRMENLKTSISQSNTKLETLQTQLTSAQQDLQRGMDRLDDKIAPFTNGLIKATVEVMDPDFKEADYKRINGLNADENAFEHFLANASKPNVYTNYARFDASAEANASKFVSMTLTEYGIDPTTVAPEVLEKLERNAALGFRNMVDAGASVFTNPELLQSYVDIAGNTLASNISNSPYKNATYTPELRARLDSLGFDMEGIEDGAALTNYEKAALFSQDQISSGKGTNKAILDTGVSWQDVASGKATISNRDGQRIWTLPEKSGYIKRTSVWSPAYGRITTEAQYDKYNRLLSETQFYPSGEAVGPTTYYAVKPITDQDKISALTQIKKAGMNIDSVSDVIKFPTEVAGYVASSIDHFIRTNQDTALIAVSSALNDVKNTANKVLRDASEDVVSDFSEIVKFAESTDNETIKRSLYIALNAAGQVLQAVNGAVVIADESPKGTILGDFANSLIKMTAPLTSDEYKQGVKDYKKALSGYGATYQKAYDAAKKRGASEEAAKAAGLKAYNNLSWVERRVEGIVNFADAVGKYPEQFVTETIAVEGASELLPLVVSAGTYGAARIALRKAGDEFAKRAAKNIALKAGGASDLVEAFGGAADGAFTRAYDVAIKAGYTEPQALEYAKQLALETGIVGGSLAFLGMNLPGNPGMALEKTLLNKSTISGVAADKFNKLGASIAEGTSIFLKEGGTEFVEEYGASLYSLAHMKLLDPTIDVDKESFDAGLMGFVAGSTVSSGMYAGYQTGTGLANTLMLFNSDVRTLVENTPDTPADIAAAQTMLTNLGITGPDQIDILNNISDNSFVGTGEAFSYFYNANPNYNPSDDEFYSFVGAANDNNTPEAISNYVDTRSTTTQEVIDRAAAEGYTLSVEDAQQYVGQGGANFEANTLGNVALKYDPLATTLEEVEQKFRELGFTPNPLKAAQFVKAGNENDTLAEIASYVDPRQVTEAEARKFFADLGFEPDDTQLANFVKTYTSADMETDARRAIRMATGREAVDLRYDVNGDGKISASDATALARGEGGANFQSTIGTNIASYVNPRQVTEAEAQKFFADLGFTPLKEQVQQFIGQGGADFEATTGTNIASYVDPRQVTEAEARQYFASQNYTPSNEDLQQFIGQDDVNYEANIGPQIAQYVDPRQVTEAEARRLFAERNFNPTDAQVRQFIGQGGVDFQSNTGTNISTFIDPRQLTEQEVRALYAKYDYDPSAEEISQFVGQGDQTFQETAPSRIFDYVDPRQVTNEEARKFFADLNYDASDAEIARFVAQVEQTTQAENIAKYVDPRQVTMAELQAIADEENITLTEALAQTYIGQGGADFQAKQLAAARKEYDPLATTMTEVAEFFAATNYTATPEEMAAFVASKTEETQRSAISAYVNPRQVTEAEATQFFADLGYAADPEEIAKFVGQLNDDTYQQTQLTNLGAYVDPRMVDLTEVQDFISNLGVDITKAREEDINKLVGQYDESLLAGRVQEVLPVITTNMLTDELTAVQNLLGKPGQQVTQADLDFLTSSIASNIVLNEQQTAQYDVNADGVVDAADQALLQQAFTGTPVSFAETSVYSPTGMYKTLQDQRIQAANDQQALSDQLAQQQQAALQAQQELQSNFEQQLEQQQQMTQDLVTQTAIETQTAIQQQAEAQRNKDLFKKMIMSPGYGITSNQVDPAKIDYIYDFSSIFANPQQAALYGSPFGYREGGQVDATTDKLLRIIGGS